LKRQSGWNDYNTRRKNNENGWAVACIFTIKTCAAGLALICEFQKPVK